MKKGKRKGKVSESGDNSMMREERSMELEIMPPKTYVSLSKIERPIIVHQFFRASSVVKGNRLSRIRRWRI